MTISRLLLKPFCSHHDTLWEPGKGVTWIYGNNLDKAEEGASNASGKTTLLFAACWALYGETPKEASKNAVIPRGIDQAHVELDLVGPEGFLQIVRNKGRKTSETVTAYWNNVCLGSECAVVQPKLDNIFGISWEVFCNTVFLGPQSTAIQFVKATPGKRSAILGELINDKVFQEAADRAGSEIKLLNTELERATSSVGQLERQCQSIVDSIQRISQTYQEEQHQQQLREASTAQQVSELQVANLRLADRLREGPKGSASEMQAQVNQLQQLIVEQQNQRAGKHYRVQQQDPTVGTECPTCAQVFSTIASSKLKGSKELLRVEVLQLDRSLLSLQGKQQELQQGLAELRAWGSISEQLKAQIQSNQVAAFKLKSGLENRTLVVLHNEREQGMRQLKETQEMAAEKKLTISQANQRLPVLKTCFQGLKYDIRNLLADDIRTILAFYASQYLEILAGNELKLEFPSTTKSGQEKFIIEIHAEGESCELTSGGEDYRAHLSVLLALRKALTCQNKSCFDFLMIDEAMTFCDDSGNRAFANLVPGLGVGQLFLTAPRAMDGVYGNTVLVEKQNRKSRIV